MKFWLALFFILTFSNSSWAIRSVGNGAGYSENKLLDFADGLNVWFNYCAQKSARCIANIKESEIGAFAKVFESLNIAGIKFVNRADFVNPIEYDVDQQKFLVIRNDLLYKIDLKTPLSDQNIFYVLLTEILKSAGEEIHFTANSIAVLPTFKKHPYLDVYSVENDILVVNSNESFSQVLLQKHAINKFRVLSETSQGYIIKDQNSLLTYAVVFLKFNQSYQFKLYLQFDD